MLVEDSNHQESRVPPGILEVYELLCVPVLAVDNGFNIIYINEKACEMTGYSRDDIKGKKLFDIAATGDLKKKLLRLFQGQVFERDFTVRSTLMTRNGRVRNVEWQCRTMFQGIFKAGAVITFVDLTGAETVLDMARIMAGSDSMERLAYGFMDMISDPLNLKLSRIILHTEDRQSLAFFRAYPNGAVHKKPRHALNDTCDVSSRVETSTFPLQTAGRCIGLIEITPYGGSHLTAEDESYVRRLCDVFSDGVERMVAIKPSEESHTDARKEAQAPGLEPRGHGIPQGPIEGPDMTHHLMNLLPQGVIICSDDGRITTVNESLVRILGIPRDEIEGQDARMVVRRLVPENENGMPLSVRNMAICRALRTGKPVMNIRSSIRVNGSQRMLNVSAIPVSDARGIVTGCLATFRDITVINSIIQIGQMALNTESVSDLVEGSLDLIMNAMNLRLASLYLWNGSELRLNLQKGELSGMPVPECRDVPDPMNPTLQSRAFLGGKPLLIKDYRRCASVRLFDPLARKRPVRSMAGVPLKAEDNVIGVLIAATGEGSPMDQERLAELSALCSQMAAGLYRSHFKSTQG